MDQVYLVLLGILVVFALYIMCSSPFSFPRRIGSSREGLRRSLSISCPIRWRGSNPWRGSGMTILRI
jgi:hypothetical protein